MPKLLQTQYQITNIAFYQFITVCNGDPHNLVESSVLKILTRQIHSGIIDQGLHHGEPGVLHGNKERRGASSCLYVGMNAGHLQQALDS